MMARFAKRVLGKLGKLTLVALRSFVTTLAIFLAIGLAGAGLSYYLLRAHPGYGALAAALAIVEALAIGVVIGGKRSLMMAVGEGFRSSHLGTYGVDLVFDKLLGVSSGAIPGDKNWLARGAEKIPLAQAERRLHDAVSAVLRIDPNRASTTSWFRRAVQAQLVRLVQKYTLARFRAENATTGSVDLQKVRAELESTADSALLAIVRRESKWAKVLALAGLIALILLQGFALHTLAESGHRQP